MRPRSHDSSFCEFRVCCLLRLGSFVAFRVREVPSLGSFVAFRVPLKIRPDKSNHASMGRHFHGAGCDQGCMTVRFANSLSGVCCGSVQTRRPGTVMKAATHPTMDPGIRTAADRRKLSPTMSMLQLSKFLNASASEFADSWP